jgi:hypothetical protein
MVEPKESEHQFAYKRCRDFRIPVVVHVVHNGEAIGSGSNISDAQIASQIKVLNNDFKRFNADTSKTPSNFYRAPEKSI